MADKENGRIMALILGGAGLLSNGVITSNNFILKLKGGNIAFWNLTMKGLAMVIIFWITQGGNYVGNRRCFWKMPIGIDDVCRYVDYFCYCTNIHALVSTTKEGNWGYMRVGPSVLGISLAALGGYMITKHGPNRPSLCQ